MRFTVTLTVSLPGRLAAFRRAEGVTILVLDGETEVARYPLTALTVVAAVDDS